MKKTLTVLAVLVLSGCIITSCGSEATFGSDQETENQAVITADDAIEGTALISGEFNLDEGDAISISSELENGSIKIGFITADAVMDIDSIDIDAEAVLTVTVSGTNEQIHDLPEGSYTMRAEVVEEASGTVTIEVSEGE